MAEKKKIQKVPEGWKKTELGNTLMLIRNGFSGQQVQYTTKFPITRIETISNGYIDYQKVGYVNDSPFSYLLKIGDILISNINSIKHIGKIAIYRGLQPLYHGMNLLILRVNQDNDSLFLYYALLSKKSWFEKVAAQAVNQASINQSTLRKCSLLIPLSIPEQRTIASVLSTCDEAIEKTDAKIEKLKRIKQGLMQDLFRFGIDENGKMRSEATHRFKDASLGRIPEEWDVKTLEDVVNYIGSGVTPTGGEAVYQKEGIKFVRSQNVTFKGIFEEDIAYINESIHKRMQRSEIYSFDILLNITGASIGRCCVVPEYFGKANVNQHVCAIRLLERDLCLSSFVSYFLQSHLGQKQIDILNAGGNREGLNYQQIRSFHIYWPTKPEQSRIASILSSADEAIEKEEAYKNKLLAIKRGLMDDLLSGKVRVNKLTKEAA